ncbi:MAG TPA: hypothetical protein VIZ19_15375 [Roseiarcus sp.]
MPGPSFEVIEAEFLLELLMRLFANPSRFDCRGERPETRVGGWIGEIALALAGGAPLADEPSLFAWHVLRALVVDAVLRTIGDPYANGGEGGRQRSLGSLAPTDAPPLRLGEHLLSMRGELIGDRTLARGPASSPRKCQLDVVGVDLLLLRDSHCPFQAPRIEPLAERRGQTIPCVGQDHREAHARGPDAVGLGERDLRLRARDATVFGHAGLHHPLGVAAVGPSLMPLAPQAGA